MVDPTAKPISLLIRECLVGCYYSPHPLAHVAKFAAKLRAEGRSEAAIREIERTVLKVLVKVQRTPAGVESP